MRLKSLILLILVVAALLWHTVAAYAVTPPPSNEPANATTEPFVVPHSIRADDISSEKVSQFVNAYLKVVSLVERREGELQAAETDSDSLRIQHEVEDEALSVIEQAGLTWQEYLQLLSLANTDAEFGERIATQLQEGGE